MEMEVKDLLKKFPRITVDRTVYGKHVKYYLSTPSGPQILVVSVSASDGRASRNNASLLRRWSNEPR